MFWYITHYKNENCNSENYRLLKQKKLDNIFLRPNWLYFVFHLHSIMLSTCDRSISFSFPPLFCWLVLFCSSVCLIVCFSDYFIDLPKVQKLVWRHGGLPASACQCWDGSRYLTIFFFLFFPPPLARTFLSPCLIFIAHCLIYFSLTWFSSLLCLFPLHSEPQ